MSNKQKPTELSIVAALIGLVTVNFSLLGLVSLNFIPWPMQILIALALGLTAYQLIVFAKRRGDQSKQVSTRIYRLLSVLILALLATSVITAAKSLRSDFSIKFILENTSTITGVATIVLILTLAGLQKNIYWISRKKTQKLDEREIKQRQEVFEASYKYGTFTVLAAMYTMAGLIYTAPDILSRTNGAASGHLIWIMMSLGVFLFALPLMVAAFKKK